MTTTATTTARIKLNHSDIAALTGAFLSDGIAGACKLRPDIPRADIEKKLRSIGVLKISATGQTAIAEIVGSVRASEHPWLVAEHVIDSMKVIIAEHARDLGGHSTGAAG